MIRRCFIKRKWVLITFGTLLGLFVFLLFLLGVPYLINYAILSPQHFKIVGEGKDWLLFWSAWLSAVFSFAMVVATFLTLRQNGRQLKELKRQWKEQNRPYIFIDIVKQENIYYLKVHNIGRQTAEKMHIKFDDWYWNTLVNYLDVTYSKDVFVDSLQCQNQVFFESILNSEINLQVNQTKFYPIFKTFEGEFMQDELTELYHKVIGNIEVHIKRNQAEITTTYSGYTQIEKINFGDNIVLPYGEKSITFKRKINNGTK